MNDKIEKIARWLETRNGYYKKMLKSQRMMIFYMRDQFPKLTEDEYTMLFYRLLDNRENIRSKMKK